MALLDKSSMPEIVSHVRSLKDVVELKLTINPSYKPMDKADAYNDVQVAHFVCPVSGLEMSGRYRFVFLRTCGCVFAEKAMKEVPSPNCHKVTTMFPCLLPRVTDVPRPPSVVSHSRWKTR